MHFDKYQKEARKTAIYPGAQSGSYAALSYAVLGLTNEAGEVAGEVKKAYRDDMGVIFEERRAAIAKEMGDVAWYLAAIASELNISLESIFAANLDKLQDRKNRGVLGGSGNDR